MTSDLEASTLWFVAQLNKATAYLHLFPFAPTLSVEQTSFIFGVQVLIYLTNYLVSLKISAPKHGHLKWLLIYKVLIFQK